MNRQTNDLMKQTNEQTDKWLNETNQQTATQPNETEEQTDDWLNETTPATSNLSHTDEPRSFKHHNSAAHRPVVQSRTCHVRGHNCVAQRTGGFPVPDKPYGLVSVDVKTKFRSCVNRHLRTLSNTSPPVWTEFRSCVRVEVAVLGCPS